MNKVTIKTENLKRMLEFSDSLSPVLKGRE